MAKVIASATLAATVMPLLSRHVRQPVLVGKYDINFSKHIDSNQKDEGNDTTVPSILFAENVMPTASGYKSAAFIEMLPPFEDGTYELLTAFVGTNETGSAFLVALFRHASNPGYIYFTGTTSFDWYNLGGAYEWLEGVPTLATGAADLVSSDITTAILKGKTYMFIRGVGMYYLGTPVTGIFGFWPAGFDHDAIGICAASGYLLAWTETEISWSALEDPLDFVASDVTGAGGGAIAEVLGNIKFCKATQNGFMIYSDLNAVFAQASADFRFPFIFSSIPYLVGIADSNDVSALPSHEHIVKSGSSIYRVIKNQATSDFTDFYTFLSSKLIENFDGEKLVETSLDNTDVVFAVADGNVVVISYKSSGATQYDHALVSMGNLGRQGKLKIDHSLVITWPFDSTILYQLVKDFESQTIGSVGSQEPPLLVDDLGTSGISTEGINTVCFINKNGATSLLTDTVEYPADATLILGPFQLAREAMAELTKVEATVADAAGCTCKVLTSITGEDVAFTTTLPAIQLGKKVRYNSRLTGMNHSICIQGAFDLSSVLLEILPKARR